MFILFLFSLLFYCYYNFIYFYFLIVPLFFILSIFGFVLLLVCSFIHIIILWSYLRTGLIRIPPACNFLCFLSLIQFCFLLLRCQFGYMELRLETSISACEGSCRGKTWQRFYRLINYWIIKRNCIDLTFLLVVPSTYLCQLVNINLMINKVNFNKQLNLKNRDLFL